MPAARASAARGCGVSMLVSMLRTLDPQRLVGDAEPVAECHLWARGPAPPRAGRARGTSRRLEAASGPRLKRSRSGATTWSSAEMPPAGDAVAVDLDKGRHHWDIGKGLGKWRAEISSTKRARSIQQPGLGDYVWPAGDAADGDTLPREPPEPAEHVVVEEGRRVAAGAYADITSAVRCLSVSSAIGDDGDAVRGHNRFRRRVPRATSDKAPCPRADWPRAIGSIAAA